jgi:hypothetical protein
MSTVNVTLGADWQQIATAAQGLSLSLPYTKQAIELAVGTTEADPAHRYNGDPRFLTRAQLGEGAIYARAQGDGATITLTTWTTT